MEQPKGPRRPGRPTARERVIGPAEIIKIAEWHIQHIPLTEIAERLGVDEATVRHHIRQTIRPQWEQATRRPMGEELARVDLLEKTAWECFHKSTQPATKQKMKEILAEAGDDEAGDLIERVVETTFRDGDTAWHAVIQWCIDYRTKVAGFYAPDRMKVTHAGEVRVAGQTRELVDAALMERIRHVAAEVQSRNRLAQFDASN